MATTATTATQLTITIPEGAPAGSILSIPVKGTLETIKAKVPEGLGPGCTLVLTKLAGSDQWVEESPEAGSSSVAPQAEGHTMPDPQPDLTPPGPVAHTVRLDTTVGVIDIIVRPDWAPHGARRFLELAAVGDLEDLSFYRAVRGCLAQFGLPARRLWPPLPDDPATGVPFLLGAVCFAAVGQNSRKSNLFICTGDMSHCFGQSSWETPIGAVAENSLDALDRIESCYGDIAECSGNGPNTGRIHEEGNAYLRAEFPRLTYIRSAWPLDWAADDATLASLPPVLAPPQAQVPAQQASAQLAPTQPQWDAATAPASAAPQPQQASALPQGAQASEGVPSAATRPCGGLPVTTSQPASYTPMPMGGSMADACSIAPAGCGGGCGQSLSFQPPVVGGVSSQRPGGQTAVIDVPVSVGVRSGGGAKAAASALPQQQQPTSAQQQQQQPQQPMLGGSVLTGDSRRPVDVPVEIVPSAKSQGPKAVRDVPVEVCSARPQSMLSGARGMASVGTASASRLGVSLHMPNPRGQQLGGSVVAPGGGVGGNTVRGCGGGGGAMSVAVTSGSGVSVGLVGTSVATGLGGIAHGVGGNGPGPGGNSLGLGGNSVGFGGNLQSRGNTGPGLLSGGGPCGGGGVGGNTQGLGGNSLGLGAGLPGQGNPALGLVGVGGLCGGGTLSSSLGGGATMGNGPNLGVDSSLIAGGSFTSGIGRGVTDGQSPGLPGCGQGFPGNGWGRGAVTAPLGGPVRMRTGEGAPGGMPGLMGDLQNGSVAYGQFATGSWQPHTQGGGGSLFNLLDRNHDGVITRDEFGVGPAKAAFEAALLRADQGPGQTLAPLGTFGAQPPPLHPGGMPPLSPLGLGQQPSNCGWGAPVLGGGGFPSPPFGVMPMAAPPLIQGNVPHRSVDSWLR
eukprot:CAMPEP_0117459670 /NCGR_PEP_ID=MMETSP0784-20121206/1601_1 /TAXON_ID=39447 /ORGANISM="" /LENGTH=899 /DNA_ID=CAMNT_0005253297 /DNA_START=37 /DNA_END=2733 /DNA_ORIENTATION=+